MSEPTCQPPAAPGRETLREPAGSGGVARERVHARVRVALAQLPIVDGNLKENLRLAQNAGAEAARHGVDLLNLPEAADWGWLHQRARREALPIPGEYTELLSDLARQYGFWISAGCLERDGDRVYNSAVILDRTGQIVLKHRKIDTLPWLTGHLYDADQPGRVQVIDTELGRIGMTICADNFDLARPKRVADQGAWLLVAPHGFAAEQSRLKQNATEFQNHICNIAGASGLWVVGTNAVLGTVQGGAWKGWSHSGCSTLARSDGAPAAVARFNEPDLVVFEIPAGDT